MVGFAKKRVTAKAIDPGTPVQLAWKIFINYKLA
jgi:hypothetical protein